MKEHLCKVVYDIILYRHTTRSIGNVSYIRKYGLTFTACVYVIMSYPSERVKTIIANI